MANPDPASLKDLEGIIERILEIALSLGGLTAFIMLIVGGFKYLVSGGDPKQTDAARSTITMAIVGIIIAIGAWFILSLLADLTGINLFEFSINPDF